jgi:hypothetical protein
MYAVAKAALLCTQLFSQQQARLETYNRFAYAAHDMPMYVVNTLPVAVMAWRAQRRYDKYCR